MMPGATATGLMSFMIHLRSEVPILTASFTDTQTEAKASEVSPVLSCALTGGHAAPTGSGTPLSNSATLVQVKVLVLFTHMKQRAER